MQGRGTDWEPTHILVMGGSGVPGESGLMRLWYAADAAVKHPGVPVWMALACAEGNRGDPAAVAYAGELRLRGVADGRCEPRACGENTREQALALVRALDAGGGAEGNDVPRVLLVTSPEHVRRACLAVRRSARDGGRAIEVRGLAAENLSLDDHVAVSEASAPVARPDVEAAKEGGSAGTPAVLRYDFWNNAQLRCAPSVSSSPSCTTGQEGGFERTEESGFPGGEIPRGGVIAVESRRGFG